VIPKQDGLEKGTTLEEDQQKQPIIGTPLVEDEKIIEVVQKKDICAPMEKQQQTTTTSSGNDVNENSQKGTITVKKVNPNAGKLISNAVLKVSPNPYTLQDSITIKDNAEAASTPNPQTEVVDCDPIGGVTEIPNVELSKYEIQEISAADGSVLHDIKISVHEELPDMTINIVDREDLGTPLDGKKNKIPNQFIVTLDDDSVSADADAQSLIEQVTSKAIGSGDDAVEVLHVYDKAVKGVAIQVENQTLLDQILLDPRVSSVEQDQIGRIATATTTSQSNQLTSRNQ